MVRRYRRRIVNKDKYSCEQTIIRTDALNQWPSVPAGTLIGASRQFKILVVPPTDQQGMRKVKHLTFSVSNGEWANTSQSEMVYALVYVPSGYSPQNINLPEPGAAIPMYDANQYVMSQGVLDFTGGPCRIKSPLSRNLNSGDSIYLIIATPYQENPGTDTLLCSVKYAITLQ